MGWTQRADVGDEGQPLLAAERAGAGGHGVQFGAGRMQPEIVRGGG